MLCTADDYFIVLVHTTSLCTDFSRKTRAQDGEVNHEKSFAGGPVDVEWLQESPRVGAILTAWYPGEMARALLSSLYATTALNPRAWLRGVQMLF